MNIFVLKEVAKLFSGFQNINYCGRVGDNLIKLVLDSKVFFVDLTKGQSRIFCDESADFGIKTYNAPFDLALKKYCIKAQILDCQTDGNNRILRLKCQKNMQYKMLQSTLIFEFTGKYTNAILVDSNEVILEALRKIAQNSRAIKNGIALSPLPQQDSAKLKPFKMECDIMEFLANNKGDKNTSNLTNAKKSAIENLEQKIKKLINLKDSLPPKNALEIRAKDYAKIGELLPINPNVRIQNCAITLNDYEGKKVIFSVGDDIDSRKKLINEFFAKSKKLKAKAQNITLQVQNIAENIAFLESKISFIKNAKNANDIKIIMQKNDKFSHKNTTKNPKKSPKYESFFIENTKISIGKNASENIALLHDAKSEDLWMHIRDIPSSHLIIHSHKNATIKDEILRKAGEILVGFAKLKGGNFLVDYTKRKFVKLKSVKIKDGGANVVYSNYGSIAIRA